MHVLKNKILTVLMGCALSFFVGCAGSNADGSSSRALDAALGQSADQKDARVQAREQDKQALLESMFQNFVSAVSNGASSEQLLDMLTDSSEYWLDTLEAHAKSYTPEDLDTCQFYEAYSILLYRLYEREHLWEVSEYKMLWLFLSKGGMFERFTRLNLGPVKIKNDRGSVGLAKSPEVPIMLFTWDDNDWKLDLVETVPLITKGIEATASKKSWSNKKLALYWLEQEYHMQYSRLDDSLCEPIGF